MEGYLSAWEVSGRLEIHFRGRPGSVCQDGFYDDDARYGPTMA